MERPILFSGPMVQAILEGRKTQTRRVVKPMRGFEHNNICRPDLAADPGAVWWHSAETERVGVLQECPYGQPGDRLWVRETFDVGRPWRNGDGIIEDEIIWEGRLPSEDPRGKLLFDDWCVCYRADGCESDRWRPSIFMPRWASRLTLEIDTVRVQRLWEISDDDAKAEGCVLSASTCIGASRTPHRVQFSKLWDSINSKRGYGWDVNPYVWALTFKVVQ